MSVAATVAALGALTSSCGIFVGESCPDLDEVCPDVICENYVQNREGCSTCECEGDAPPVVCWDDSECGDGQRCDTQNFCEQAPNCVEGEPCPDACYGRCVDGPTGCDSDDDCGADQFCASFQNGEERPGEPSDPPTDGDGAGAPEPAPVPAPEGVCLPLDCGGADIALPKCPPGSEPFFDGCFVTCISTDFCRDLDPASCAATPGCQLISEPCACDANGICDDCEFIERCVAVDDCAALPVEQCESNPNCVLKPIGQNGDAPPPPDGGGGGSEPDPGVPCIPEDPNCGGFVPPEEQLVCVPRGGDGTCVSDFDCRAGEICSLNTVCGSGCTIDDDGQETCFEECWTEGGVCVPGNSCFDLPPDQCELDPRCQLVDGGAGVPCACDPNAPDCLCEDPGPAPAPLCVPREGTCFSDFDCLDGQHCELIEQCPPCDPSTGDDIGCVSPCFVEGRCVDGAPPPLPCSTDADCGFGATCTVVTVCETCADSGGGSDGAPPPGDGGAEPPPPPPPCEPVCFEQGICVQTDPVCYSDFDCAGGEFCDFSQLGCNFPGGLVAQCPGLCAPLENPGLCLADADCPSGQRCATEVDFCAENPADPNNCYKLCVDDTANQGTFCLSNDECAAADGTVGQCTFHPDVCLQDPNNDGTVCSGWCTGACGDALTAAVDPATGQCIVFNDTCIPPGWVRSETGTCDQPPPP